MTKEEFIAKAEKLGYARWKDLLVELGYSERVLDRFKYPDKLHKPFLDKFKEFCDGKNEIASVDEGLARKEEDEDKVQAEDEEAIGNKDGVAWEAEKEPSDKANGSREKSVQGLVASAEQFADGIGFDVTNEDYHASGFLGSSRIKLIMENARQYQVEYVTKEKPKKKTDALLIGSMYHTLVLEPHTFDRDYIVLHGDSLKDGLVENVEALGCRVNRDGDKVKNTVAELRVMLDEAKEKSEKEIVTKAQVDIAKLIAERALESMYVIEAKGKVLLSAKLKDILKMDIAYVERTFYGKIDGEVVQVRPDILLNLGKNGDVWFCIDLKSGIDATQGEFIKGAGRFCYDLQQWIYTDVLKQNGIDIVEFRFCVAGKGEFSQASYFRIDKGNVEDAEKIVKSVIKKYKFCRENDIWNEGRFDYEKCVFESTTDIQLPAYRAHQFIDMGVL